MDQFGHKLNYTWTSAIITIGSQIFSIHILAHCTGIQFLLQSSFITEFVCILMLQSFEIFQQQILIDCILGILLLNITK